MALKNPKAKQAKREDFFDNSLVQEMVNERFMRRPFDASEIVSSFSD